MFNWLNYKTVSLNIKHFILFGLLVSTAACSLRGRHYNNQNVVYIYDYWYAVIQDDLNYVSSFPRSTTTATKRRNLHYFMVVFDNHSTTPTISLVGGKAYHATSEVIIKVNYNEYYIPVHHDRAWLTNKAQVASLIGDMKSSNELIIINTFYDNTQAIDVYSLKGFKEAFNRIEPISQKSRNKAYSI